jgi:hypothetical protein
MCEDCIESHCNFCLAPTSKTCDEFQTCDECNSAIEAAKHQRAYEIWQTTGCEDAVANWCEAELQVRAGYEDIEYGLAHDPHLPAWLQARLQATTHLRRPTE